MQYRKFGKTGFDVSALSLGCMRLPLSEDGTINESEAIAMIRHAIDSGVNYVDTAYGYHGGKSEVVLGKALKDGYREKVKISTKLPMWLVQTEEDYEKTLNEQLSRLDVDYVDFYLFHGMGKGSIDKVKDLKLLEKMEAAIANGKIKHVGFSFHDNYEAFVEVVDMYDKWSMVLVQFNYMDKFNQATENGVKYAHEKGIAVVAMEPCFGGRLANLPTEALAVVNEIGSKRTPVQWAFDWIWNYPEVSTVLSGMSSMQQLKENLVYAKSSSTGNMSDDDLAVISKIEEAIKSVPQVPCTECKYCSCPQGVNIVANIKILNDALKFGKSGSHRSYFMFTKEEERAAKCTGCGDCEAICPQSIKISEEMKRLVTLMG